MQGKTINGFELKRQLGIGGMAEVWLAENKIGKMVAVKMLLPHLCANESVKSRFLTEAKVTVQLNHPNIRQVYDFGEIDGRPAIIMEYLEGDDLKSKMKRGYRFSNMELKRWWNELVSALNYTHQKGIIHRDIKPGNIFVDMAGNIKLLDFGIAKVRESISATQTGQKLGTLMYMSPEQVKDSKNIDYRTDVYSLAVTFVHLITGKRPYDSDSSSDFDIELSIVTKPLDVSGLPNDWRQFLLPYLAKEPSQRAALRPFGTSSDIPMGTGEETIYESNQLHQQPQQSNPYSNPNSYQTSNFNYTYNPNPTPVSGTIDPKIRSEIEVLYKQGKYKDAYNKCLVLIKRNEDVDFANKKIEELVPLLQKESKKKSRLGVVIGIVAIILINILYFLYLINEY